LHNLISAYAHKQFIMRMQQSEYTMVTHDNEPVIQVHRLPYVARQLTAGIYPWF